MTADNPAIAGALLMCAYAVTRQEARDALNVAVLRGLPLPTAGDLLKRWEAANAPQVIGRTRCWCNRTVPTTSACGCCCAEHDEGIR